MRCVTVCRYNMLWYKTSQRTTRLLSILLYRGFVPCTLTAGKMYVLSMANYASVRMAIFNSTNVVNTTLYSTMETYNYFEF
ncbi:hypothetical protein ALC57_13741 [Trachymyrmex cornetzi]|uniref:Uncharacterized protein n=1 Tax=Trachymyrmex cornetzi TaxID=471704 RepID=A0A195DMV6_9HYME|nr:hypothetical protein ALC57_13741 [Trachymyrmex cornetzi]